MPKPVPVAVPPWAVAAAEAIPDPHHPALCNKPHRARLSNRLPTNPLNRPVAGFSAAWPAGLPGVFWAVCSFADLGLAAVWAVAAWAGGIGFFEILLIGGIIYLIYRFIKKKNE